MSTFDFDARIDELIAKAETEAAGKTEADLPEEQLRTATEWLARGVLTFNDKDLPQVDFATMWMAIHGAQKMAGPMGVYAILDQIASVVRLGMEIHRAQTEKTD